MRNIDATCATARRRSKKGSPQKETPQKRITRLLKTVCRQDYGFSYVEMRFTPAGLFSPAADTKTQNIETRGAQLDHVQEEQ